MKDFMENNRKENKRGAVINQTDFDKAVELLNEKFLELHSQETHPEWLSKILPLKITWDDKDGWVSASLGVYKKEIFDSNYFLKEKDGKKYVVYINPDTQEESIVINRTPKVFLELFKAVVNTNTLKLIVLVDVDLSTIKREELEITQEDYFSSLVNKSKPKK